MIPSTRRGCLDSPRTSGREEEDDDEDEAAADDGGEEGEKVSSAAPATRGESPAKWTRSMALLRLRELSTGLGTNQGVSPVPCLPPAPRAVAANDDDKEGEASAGR